MEGCSYRLGMSLRGLFTSDGKMDGDTDWQSDPENYQSMYNSNTFLLH